jgi:hypothetical protein
MTRLAAMGTFLSVTHSLTRLSYFSVGHCWYVLLADTV